MSQNEGAGGERWVEWVEPFGPRDEPVYCRVAESTAIAYMRQIPAHAGRRDEELLDEFMVVNWASFCLPPQNGSEG